MHEVALRQLDLGLQFPKLSSWLAGKTKTMKALGGAGRNCLEILMNSLFKDKKPKYESGWA